MSYSPTGLSDAISFRSGQESVVVPIYRQVAGEFPAPTFGYLRDIYLSDPDFYTAVNFVSNRALSHGFHIECDQNIPGHEDIEEFLQGWLDVITWGSRVNERGYGPLLRIITREMGWGGSSLLELVDPDNITKLAQVQLSSIWKFQRNDDGDLLAIWQYPQINPRALTPSRYLLYGWNTVDRNPWSAGLIQPVAMPKPNSITGGWIPPLINIKWQIEQDIGKRMHRYGAPHSIFGLKGINEADATEIAEYLKQPDADTSYLTDVDVTMEGDAPQGRMNFSADLDYLSGRFQAASGNVLTEMLTGKGFSYASAVKAGSLADELVWDMQAVIKTDTEYGLLYPVCQQNDIDPYLFKPKFVFNIPDNPEEWTIADLVTAAQNGIISKADFVRNAKEFGKWDLDDPIEVGPMPASPNMPGAPPVQNPGQLPVSQPGQSTNPLGIDNTAYQNMMQVQGETQRRLKDLTDKLEAIAAGGGAASGVQGMNKLPKKRSKKAS